MKKLFLLLFLIPQFISAQVQGDLYGMYFGWPQTGGYNNGIADCNPSTAAVAYMSTVTSVGIHAFGDHTMDAQHNHYFQIFGDSLDMYLMDVNMLTGATNILFTVDSVGSGQVGSVTIGGNIASTFYNCSDDEVYFTHFLAPFEDSIHFAKVNHTTGVVTEIKKIPIGYQSIDNQVYANHQIAYFFKPNSSYIYDALYAFDLVNETEQVIPLSIPVPVSSYWSLTFNAGDGMLWGVEDDLDSFAVNNYLADLRIIKVNPVSGDVTYMTSDFLGNLTGSNIVFDYTLDKMYFVLQTSNPGYFRLGSYDVASNTYAFEDFTFSGFGNLSPNYDEIDIYELPKECAGTQTAIDEITDCNTQPALSDGSTVQLGCHWQDYIGKRFMMYDLLGRKIMDAEISSSEISVPSVSTLMLYMITDGRKVYESGKLFLQE